VEPDAVFTESILFELPDLVEADAFAVALGASVLDSVMRSGDRWLVAMQLSPEASYLALVLRRAEAWLAARGLGGIWFHLDGRPYMLRATPAPALVS
jgi:hypothetical protein